MAEIRNLTRNGETFYPLTIAEAVQDPNGEFFGYYTESLEWIRVVADHEGKILAGIKTTGEIEWSLGVPQPIKDYIQENIIPILADKVDKKEGKSLIDSEYAEGISYQENPEFINVELDNEGKVLGGTKVDGSHYFYNLESETLDEIKENIEDLDSRIIDLPFEEINDIENRLQIGEDADGKIFNYRKPDGTLVENAGIETTKLELTEQGMTDFQQALKDSGFTPGGGGDWSDRDTIELPEPKHYALLNIDIDYLPTASGDVREAAIQYYDGLGNSFKMSAEIEIQGQTSRIFAQTGGKGNYTLDLPKDIKFGHWVPQDSFHLKGCAKDVVRGILPTSYKWAYLMQEYLGSKPNRVLIDESGITTTHATGERINDWPTDARCLPDGFPCELYVNGEYHGLYSWQLKKHRKNYSMDKKDYTSFFLDADKMMTDDYQHGIWDEGPDAVNRDTPTITWWRGFDIKGPKDLIVMDGSEFDGDAPRELMSKYSVTPNLLYWAYTGKYTDTQPTSGLWNSGTLYAVGDKCYFYNDDMEIWIQFVAIESNSNQAPLTLAINSVYDNSDKKHKGSRTTKNLIRKMSLRYDEVKSYITDGDIDTAKQKFNEYFDYDACMLVYIYNCLMKNSDSIKKNTLWGMYGSGKIFPSLWDLDGMYGTGWIGTNAGVPSAGQWQGDYATSEWPLKLFWTLYETEIKNVYSELRDAKKIDIDTWYDIVFNQWVNRIGEEAYNRDIKKWPETPSYRENNTDTEYWRENGTLNGLGSVPEWNDTDTYEQNARVAVRMHPMSNWYQAYRAKVQNTNHPPYTEKYEEFPQVGGFYDSPKRWQKWMEEQIKLCDIQNDYFKELLADFIAYRATDEGYEIECTNMIVDTKLSKTYNYIQGHITRHEIEIEGQIVSTYTIDGGIEAPEDTSKTYITVKAAIETAESQPVDVPSENVYYIEARAKDINYHII